MGYMDGCLIGFLHPSENSLPMEKGLPMSKIANQCKNTL